MKTLKKNIDKILYGCAAVLALTALLLMFAPASVLDLKLTQTTYTGAQMAFGLKGELNTVIFGASANILTYILLALGIISAIFGMFSKSCKYPCLIAVVCFLLAGIFSFCVVPISVTDLKEELTLGAGAVCSGVFGILAALVCAANLFVKPKKR